MAALRQLSVWRIWSWSHIIPLLWLFIKKWEYVYKSLISWQESLWCSNRNDSRVKPPSPKSTIKYPNANNYIRTSSNILAVDVSSHESLSQRQPIPPCLMYELKLLHPRLRHTNDRTKNCINRKRIYAVPHRAYLYTTHSRSNNPDWKRESIRGVMKPNYIKSSILQMAGGDILWRTILLGLNAEGSRYVNGVFKEMNGSD